MEESEAGRSRASVRLLTLAWTAWERPDCGSRGTWYAVNFAHLPGLTMQRPLPVPADPRTGILWSWVGSHTAQMAWGEALRAPGQRKGNQAPWMHPLPALADLG